MINIIVPIVDNVEAYAKFVDGKKGEMRFFVGIKESLKDKFLIKNKNATVTVFSDKAKKEEIINSLHSSKFERGKILIMRRVLTDEEFSALTNSDKDIAKLKVKQNKFVGFFKKITSGLIRKIFAFSFFDDISAICFSENLFELVSVCQNLSMASRLNKYVGVEIDEITTDQKQVKKDYNKTKTLLTLILSTILFLGSIAGIVCVCIFVEMKVLIGLVLAFWLIVASVLWFVFLLNFIRNVTIGNLRYGRAEQIV